MYFIRFHKGSEEYPLEGDLMKKTMIVRQTGMAALTLAVLAAAISGCGSASDSSSEVTSGSSEEAQTSSGEEQVMKVGVSQTLAPYIYLDDDGNLTGYDYDILVKLDEKLTDYTFDYQPADFSTNLVAIQSGAIDMMVNNLVKSEERQKLYLFPEHYSSLAPMSLAVQTDSGIASLDDMAGKSMNTNPATYEYTILDAYNKANPDKAINLIALSDLTTADNLRQVSNGTVDAALTYSATYTEVMKDLPDITNLTLTDPVLCEDMYYMIAGGEDDFCAAVDEALGELYDEGFMSENSMKWFGEDIFEKYADMLMLDFDGSDSAS